MKEMKREERQEFRMKQEKLDRKMQKVEDQLEVAQQQRDHDLMLKHEMRRLKETDLRKCLERQKNIENSKKTKILVKEKLYEEAVLAMKAQNELMLQTKVHQAK
jgi:hypothetical protein